MEVGVIREISRPIMELNEIPRNHCLYSRSLIENKVIPFAHNLFGELNPEFYFDGDVVKRLTSTLKVITLLYDGLDTVRYLKRR